MVPLFLPHVDKILNSSALSARELLAKALSKVSVSEKSSLRYLYVLLLEYLLNSLGIVEQGYTDIKTRSLLSSMEDSVTLLLKVGTPIYTMS